jgi:cytochrome oxidase Cu insertion factor (SCO1/SenC/PrrC family)
VAERAKTKSLSLGQALTLTLGSKILHASEGIGVGYFTNVTLVTHEGEEVLFYDDLVASKVVETNFIFTNCRDSYSCPAEIAKLISVSFSATRKSPCPIFASRTKRSAH